jgi:hypothetical protein
MLLKGGDISPTLLPPDLEMIEKEENKLCLQKHNFNGQIFLSNVNEHGKLLEEFFLPIVDRLGWRGR